MFTASIYLLRKESKMSICSVHELQINKHLASNKSQDMKSLWMKLIENENIYNVEYYIL